MLFIISDCMTERAQSAMEYLITYSWAIIIISVTLAALYALGVFNPNNFVTNQCTFPADFGCLSGFIYSSGPNAGNFVFNIQQSTPSAINVTAVGCNAAGFVTNMTSIRPQIYLPIGANATLNVPCFSNGTLISTSTQSGVLYKGSILVNYTTLNTGFQHILVGKIIQKAT